MFRIKLWVKRVLRVIGYELRTLPRSHLCHLYDFPDQKAALANRSVDVILDVGANIGQSVDKYRRLFPHATIHSFEPVPEVYQMLTVAVAGDVKVHAWPLAVSDCIGTASFYINSRSDTSSLLPVHESQGQRNGMDTCEVATVSTVTLDRFCAERQIDSVAILKLDIQGGEIKALRGAEGLLSRHAIDLLFVEVWFHETYRGVPFFSEVDVLLRGYGYRLYGLYNLNSPHQIYNSPVEACDAIYLSPAAVANLDPTCGGLDGRFGLAFG